MPELPEVETMVRGLRPVLSGRRILRALVHDPFLLQGFSADDLAGRLAGEVVLKVRRSGKWVVLELAKSQGIIVIEPRMSGAFWLVAPARPEHTRLTIDLDKPEQSVWYCDTRRLGKIRWYDSAELADCAMSRSQGTDALEISASELHEKLTRTSRAVKPALMDQKVLAGVGNIYADETLFHAGIHPERKASRLTKAETGRIHSALVAVLRAAIAAEGTSFDQSYRTVLGLEGGFLAENSMYGRAGMPCKRCTGMIVKTKIRGLIGRPTYYCPTCQPASARRKVFRAPAEAQPGVIRRRRGKT